MNDQTAKLAAKAWFPYFYARNALAGAVVLASYTFYELLQLESGEVEMVRTWKPVSMLYDAGGLWVSMIPFALLILGTFLSTVRYRKNFLSLKRQVTDQEFKSAKRAIEVKNAEDSHIFGGKKTSLKQFILVLLGGMVVAAVILGWILNNG